METEDLLDVQQHSSYRGRSSLRLENSRASSGVDKRVPELDTVRALHRTVISLRTKLDTTEGKLRRLRDSVNGQDFSTEHYAKLLEKLSLENHVLRRKLLNQNRSLQALKSTKQDTSRLIEQSKPTTKMDDSVVNEMKSEESNVDDPTVTGTIIAERENDETNMNEHQLEECKEKKLVFEMTRSRATNSESSSEDLGEVKESEKQCEEKAQDCESPAIGRLNIAEKELEDLSLKSASEGDNSVFSDCEPSLENQQPQQQTERRVNESEDDSEELDDIELIFTTDDTCRDVGLQEDLVSITENEDTWKNDEQRRQRCQRRRQQQLKQEKSSERQQKNCSQPILLKYTKSMDLAEGLICNGAPDKINSSVEEAVSSQSSSIDREESIDKFDESSSTRLNKMWSQCSVLVETDISKCGVLEEEQLEQSVRQSTRRNTLAAPPAMTYRPIIHREALALGSRRKSSGAVTASNAIAPLRPVVDYRSCSTRRESGAQTDISALPAHWRSESYLAHKVAHTFTTLPSKFALPTGIPSPGRLRLSEKTREARRVMLSDISFTSMVPELSRSADHLCHESHVQTCYNNSSNNTSSRCGLRTPEIHRRESLGSPSGYWSGRCNPSTGLPSPCECRISNGLYTSRYRGSLTSIPSPGLEIISAPSRRHSWRSSTSTTTASFDTWRASVAAPSAPNNTPPDNNIVRAMWSSSMPSSPTHIHPSNASAVTKSTTATRFMKHFPKRTRSKVTFQECPMNRGSLPNLYSELIGENSGDSTESLIDEAEDYLRRSIDSMLTTSSSMEQNWSERQLSRRRRTRRYSEPDLFHEWNPPQNARPYLPKIPRDLKLDHLVKVISPEGKVLQGRVRYVGPVLERDETYVGVELPTDNGFSDGTFHGKIFFHCEQNRAVFVPFKKVVLAWCTT